MKKLKQLKIRKVWTIKPMTKVKPSSKQIILAKIKKRELREGSGNGVALND